jgi:hypothetical protein
VRGRRGRPRKATARRRQTTLAGRCSEVGRGSELLRERKRRATGHEDLLLEPDREVYPALLAALFPRRAKLDIAGLGGTDDQVMGRFIGLGLDRLESLCGRRPGGSRTRPCSCTGLCC